MQFPFFHFIFLLKWNNQEILKKKKHEKDQKQLPQSVTLFQQEKTWERSEAVASACNFIKKETLPKLCSCEFCEISKGSFSNRTPPELQWLLLKNEKL